MFISRNAAHQGARKRSLVGIYHLFDIDDNPSLFQSPDAVPEFFTEVEDTPSIQEQERVKGVGLMRSQSFPPEGWYKTTSKNILKVSKTRLSSDEEVRFPKIIGVEHEEGVHSIIPSHTSELVDAYGYTSPTATELMEERLQHNAVDIASKHVHDISLAQEDALSFNHATAVTITSMASDGDTLAITSPMECDNFESESSSLIPNLVDSSTSVSPSPSAAMEVMTLAIGHSVPDSTFPPSGKVLVCGRRREMEDAASIVPSFLNLLSERVSANESQPKNEKVPEWHFFGVFDGHGGSQASIYCVDRLHHVVADEYMKVFQFGASSNEIGDECNMAWTEIMKAAFSKMDEEVGGVCPNAVPDGDDEEALDGGCLCCEDAIAPENVGTTAVVALVGVNQIIVANCGDSRAVLARGSQAIPLSRDHKPEREDETRRIEAAGGRVIRWDGYRVGGLLALSRAIGDRYLKRYVISEPDVTCIQREEDDECLILASDGLWDVLGNEFACEVARRSLATVRKKYEGRTSPPGEDAAAAAVAALLVKLAYGRGSQDNISVVVVDLKSRKRSS